MPTRRQVVAGGVSSAAVLATGCTSVLESWGSSPSSGTDGNPDEVNGSSDDADDAESAGKENGSDAAAITADIDVDRPNRPRLGASIDVEVVVTNEGEQAGSYDYRLRLEHEDGLLGGDETVSGTLPAGKHRVYDLEFTPPRAGTVCLLLEKNVVDEFVVRSRRSGDDDETDDNSDDDDGDNGTPVTTGGEATVVGDEATSA